MYRHQLLVCSFTNGNITGLWKPREISKRKMIRNTEDRNGRNPNRQPSSSLQFLLLL